jgi:hypothetical protein
MWAKAVAFTAGAAVGFGAVLVGRAVLARYEQEGGLPTPFEAARADMREFAQDVADGMAEREGQLRVALGLDDATDGKRLDPEATRALLDDPARWRAPKG